jgi:type III secretion system YscQ/HrcQ family protein
MVQLLVDTMQTRPFPYDRWQRLTRRQVELLHSASSLWDESKRARAVRAASDILGGEVHLSAGVGSACSLAQATSVTLGKGPRVGVLLEYQASATTELPGFVVLELGNDFAQRLVDRALGGEGELSVPALAPLDELSRGALAYVIARVLAALGGGLSLRDLALDSAALSGWLAGKSSLVCFPIELAVGADHTTLRLYVPDDLRLPARRRDPSACLDELPLTLIAELGWTRLPAAIASELAVGDIVVLDEASLVYDGQAFRGNVTVRVAGSRCHCLCRAVDTALEVERMVSSQEPQMTTGRLTQSTSANTLGTGLAADAPLEISVELARFSLTLGELGRTAPGDVLVTGRRIGEQVTLRVGGRALAQGELVDVEGEIGVRLLSVGFEAAP